MAKEHVLIIEDDEDIQQLVSFNLIKAGYHVSCVGSGEEGLRLLQSEAIDCVLLDIMLPGKNGLEICRKIRGSDRSLPVVMMTARGEDDEIIEGLAGGADDYITKPFSPKILVARVMAVLRRKVKAEDDAGGVIAINDLTIYPGRHEVFVGGEKINLTITEFAILFMLVKRPGWVFSRQQIIDAVRGSDYMVTPRVIDVQVFSLRKKLGDAGADIETVRGVGYRFKD